MVERSSRPAEWTLDKTGVQRRTFYRWYDRYLEHGEGGLVDRAPHPGRIWDKISDKIRAELLDMALDIPELSPRELAVRFMDTKGYFVSESSVYRLLKALDLIYCEGSALRTQTWARSTLLPPIWSYVMCPLTFVWHELDNGVGGTGLAQAQ